MNPQSESGVLAGIGHWRRRAIGGLIAGLLAASLASIFTQTEVWPICPYSMFAERIQRGDWDALKVYFVYGNQEVALPPEEGLLHRDFDGVSVSRILRNLVGLYGIKSSQMERFLKTLMEVGPLKGNRVEGIRLYRVFYTRTAESGGVPKELRRELKREVIPGVHE